MRRIGLAVALAVSLALAPPAASAQLGKVYRIGVLHPGTSQTSSTEAFRQALRELGYVEGQTLGIEWRWAAGNPERYPDLATHLVRSSVDVIVAAHGETALAAKRATQTIPIVVAASVDAVKEGLVVSLARPGGNVTGLSTMIPELTPELTPKRFELLKEIVPGLSRVALLWNPEMGVALLKEHEAAARSVGLEPRRLAVRTAAELTQAFLEATRTRCGAIVAVQNPIFSVHRTRIAQLALHNRLPAISGEPLFAEVGGLLTYGPNLLESWRRSAVYVDKILKGAKPADLPVEQPTKFELIINLKTAKALGLTIPQSVLGRADQVIQ